jgi:ribose transport system substrate-binding protein
MEQALNIGADVIYLGGIDQNVVREQIQTAKSRGVKVVSTSAGNTPGPDGVDVDVSQDGEAMGLMMGNYIVVDTEGQANLLPTQDFLYPVIVTYVETVIDFLKENCPDCEVHEPLAFTGEDVVDTLPQKVVSELQANPEINTLLVAYDPAADFITPAVNNAGLGDKVRIYAQVGAGKAYDFIAQGPPRIATVAEPIEWEAWAGFDAAMRLVEGAEIPEYDIPAKLIDKTNLPPEGERWTGSEANYEGEFKALWGLQ